MESNKYIIEGNINFYSELMKDDDSDDNMIVDNDDKEKKEDELCLLSGEPLDKTMLKLPSCGHKFNYIPLYKEIYNQKRHLNIYETAKLLDGQIKCPYCRTICNLLLPPSSREFGLNEVSICRGVNLKDYNTDIIIITCEHLKKKTYEQCSSKKVYITDKGRYCRAHYNRLIKQNLKHDENKANENKANENKANENKANENKSNEKNNIHVINELFSNQSNQNIKVAKNKVIKTKNVFYNNLVPNNMEDVRNAFNYFLRKDDIKIALSRHNYHCQRNHRITITHTKDKLIEMVFKYGFYKSLELWEGTSIFNYLSANIEKIKQLSNQNISVFDEDSEDEMVENPFLNTSTHVNTNLNTNLNISQNSNTNNDDQDTDDTEEFITISNNLQSVIQSSSIQYYDDEIYLAAQFDDDIELINFLIDMDDNTQ
jgi:hypothetical protein